MLGRAAAPGRGGPRRARPRARHRRGAAIPRRPGSGGDIAALGGTDAWHPAIAGCDPVVNGAGMLQDGPCDDLRAVRALVRACLEVAIYEAVQDFAVDT